MSLTVPGVAALFGLIAGSFAGVLVARVPSGGDVVRGRSRCDACGAVLRPLELVPVVSWMLLHGRCRSCGARVPSRWTVIELTCAVAFAAIAVVLRNPWQVALLAPFSVVLIALTVIDLEHQRLPNAIVYPSAVLATAVIVAGWGLRGVFDLLDALIGSAAYGGGLLAIAVASRGGMGLGDVKLAGLVGLVVGAIDLPSVAVAAGAAIVLGGVAGIVALARGAGRRSALPFGPMIAAGALIGALAGPPLADAYLGLLR